MRQWRLGLGLGCGLLTQVALGGTGWVGGGGELTGDAANPWFIQNTPVVKACIEIDREHFHLAPEIADLEADVVRPVLDYWQDQIKHADVVDYGGPTVFKDIRNYPVIGTQSYEFGPCTDATDLRFEFGMLSPAQRQAFAGEHMDPQRFVSLAVRTDYDPVNLRGRGFIYVAPDSGELKPRSDALLNKPWTLAKGQLLRNVLAHEFGHVLGLRHSNDNAIAASSTGNLMSPYYPEMILRQDRSWLPRSIPDFFRTDRGRIGGYCEAGRSLSPATIAFLDLDKTARCFEARVTGPDTIDVLSDPVAGNSAFTKVGTITLAPSRVYSNYRNLLHLWLPPQQTLITLPDWYKVPELLVLPVYAGAQRSGTYRSLKGNVERQLLVTQNGTSFELTTILADGGLTSIPQNY